MARGTRTVHPSKRNKGLSSTFQPPEEGLSVQRPKRCNKHGDEDEDNSPKNVNNVHNSSSQKYGQILSCVISRNDCLRSRDLMTRKPGFEQTNIHD